VIIDVPGCACFALLQPVHHTIYVIKSEVKDSVGCC